MDDASPGAERMLNVFVKAGPKIIDADLESLLNSIQSPHIRPPRHYGSFSIGPLNVGIWEFHDGERIPFEELSLETLERLVRGVAVINATPVEPSLAPVKTKWISEPLDWYRKRMRTFEPEAMPAWEAALERLTPILSEPDLLDQISAGFGERLLTHNDINPNNVFTPETGDVVMFDWEGATLSVPGADLRFLVRLPDREPLLDVYLEEMAARGIDLDRETVRRSYHVIEGFRMIFKGWAGRNLNAVTRGLDIVEEQLAAARALPTRSQTNPSTTLNDPVETKTMTDVHPVVADSEVGARTLKAPSPELVERINQYVAEKGAIYAPIDHPAFADVPVSWKDKRFDLFRPHLEHQGGTALDIGTHWGYMAHRLEDEGYRVTANEHSPKHLYFLREIRDICGKKFDIIEGNIFAQGSLKYDVIIALNIFHHFLKTDERFENFQKMLRNTECKMMIYQAHRSTERPKLDAANHFMEPQMMAEFIADRLRLQNVQHLGADGGRDIFKIS